jgi:hypothetical protein
VRVAVARAGTPFAVGLIAALELSVSRGVRVEFVLDALRHTGSVSATSALGSQTATATIDTRSETVARDSRSTTGSRGTRSATRILHSEAA